MRWFASVVAGVAMIGCVGALAPAQAADVVDNWGQCVAHGWTDPSGPSEFGQFVGPYLLNGQGGYAGPLNSFVRSEGNSRFDAATVCVK